jgi:hypothetical protein
MNKIDLAALKAIVQWNVLVQNLIWEFVTFGYYHCIFCFEYLEYLVYYSVKEISTKIIIQTIKLIVYLIKSIPINKLYH